MGQLRLSGVTKSFGTAQVIQPTDLEIEDGEFVVFVGPSGCGKSTMLRMIAGLEEITSGTVEIDGKVVNDLAPVKRGISMVFQSYALYPHMSVYENIAFPLRVAKTPQAKVDELVGRAAKVLKLENRLQHRPGALSGGQRQRVAIGRAIVREPSVFLFDEPLSNLDAALRAEMRVELSRLHSQLGNSMIYVTHDQVEAMTMADKIVVLRDGLIEQVGSPLELYHRPANRFVAGFIGTPNMNFLPGTVDSVGPTGVTVALKRGGMVTVEADGRTVQPGEAVELGIRPDALTVGTADGALSLMPEVVERLGSSTVVYCQDEDGTAVCLVADGALNVRPGQKVTAGIPAAEAHLFRADGSALPRTGALPDLPELA
ncbi:ABC transporter ATP-binding protein [Pseudoroseicyclus aestuarii]|uniref:Carbohydrate ABC transporter ATP-binding protein (CUT1 family) n=1 Tax=Pseudoroseicyclus aestuarii TaxID=1795041 RepID=A0A318SUU5_9RHOB|nr:sn-glycerol-3-phosphate ABC transporter ATP-binding protein UgpC [Pseudoroseicyclus aestuarii]PYE85681.1 carbohydrate ABC transporter ATP-binding protein (CUT1 family) [Pseudoroseicyclus aestuarii]